MTKLDRRLRELGRIADDVLADRREWYVVSSDGRRTRCRSRREAQDTARIARRLGLVATIEEVTR